ncbi:hypothetical protein [Corynebacterium sp. ACRPQ]|uniref:hypothetical protein n=1 Tax=Corynebacterium sp. ACRPQ TaxID=2918201 RepID=UPI001EF16A7E|nr:hypothetical protein [Corynebacterium sp. ACRPQ]MCG7440694.1 hypothetical protein [Corynebacterium sp. ACRPQ]
MNNQYKAAEVIRTWQKRHPIVMESNPDWAAQNLAGDLQEAGLLAPDTPQPFFEHGNGPNWEIPINDEDGGLIIVRALGGEVFIERKGRAFSISPAEARKLTAAILAAANHREEA